MSGLFFWEFMRLLHGLGYFSPHDAQEMEQSFLPYGAAAV